MTTMTRFVPFRAPLEDVAVLQNRLNSIFRDFAMPSNGMETESLAAGNFVPAVDIYEDSHRLLLKLEVPGIRQEDLDIRVENQALTVKGERKFAQDEKEENFHRIERRFGSFVRSFTLPMTVDTGSVKAACQRTTSCLWCSWREGRGLRCHGCFGGRGRGYKPVSRHIQENAVRLMGNDRMIYLISASSSAPRGPHAVHQNLWIYSLMSVR
jgi:HSP20 family protein